MKFFGRELFLMLFTHCILKSARADPVFVDGGYSQNNQLSSGYTRDARDLVNADLASAKGADKGGCDDAGGGKGDTACGVNITGGDPKQKGSNIAHSAAVDAKAAADAQMSAGEAAAQQIRTQYAEKAVQAAKAAEAALAGKQQVVQQLEAELKEAEAELRDEEASAASTQNSVGLLQEAAQNARDQLALLLKALADAERNLATAQAAFQGAQNELGEKKRLTDSALKRLEDLYKKMEEAKKDYEVTKQAAYRAVCAAAEAKKAGKARDARSTTPYNK